MEYPQLTRLATVMIQNYERYLPTAFDESMSILQKLNKIIEFMNQTGILVNSAVDLIEQAIIAQDLDVVALQKEMVDYKTNISTQQTDFETDISTQQTDFETDISTQQTDFESEITNNLLPANMVLVLDEWFTSGKLAEIINTQVFDMKANQVDLDIVTAQLADNAISPEKFTGTDFQKVQAALDYAIANDVAIKFAKMYNITGAGSLSINKANGSWDLDRRVLYLQGVGGGIRKDDAGFVFTAPYQNVGDINVKGLKYYSVAGAGTHVWDCDKIIRMTSSECKYLDVDTVASTPNQYFQSMYFRKEHITGGSGWAFEFKECWDTEIDCLIEARQNGIRNTVGLAKVQNTNLTIKGVIEGLSGIAIQLGSCYGSEISCYFEKNQGGHIDLQTLDQYYQYSLLITKNTFAMTVDQITNSFPAVKMGKIFTGPNNAVVSIANVCNGTMYNLYANEGGWMVGLGDRAITPVTGKTSRYVQLSQLKSTVSAVGASPYIQWGPMTKESTSTPSTSFTAGETKAITMIVDVPALAGDAISFSLTNSANFQVLSHEIIANAVNVNVKNLTGTTQSTVITMSVLKLF